METIPVLHHNSEGVICLPECGERLLACVPPSLAELRAEARGAGGCTSEKGASRSKKDQYQGLKLRRVLPSPSAQPTGQAAPASAQGCTDGVPVPIRIVPSTAVYLPAHQPAFQGLAPQEPAHAQGSMSLHAQQSSTAKLAEQRLRMLDSVLQALVKSQTAQPSAASGGAGTSGDANAQPPWSSSHELRLVALLKAKCSIIQTFQAQDVYRLGLLLEVLYHMPVTPMLLANSQIAPAVKGLCASPCPAIAAAARTVLSHWKQQVLAHTAPSPASARKDPAHAKAPPHPSLIPSCHRQQSPTVQPVSQPQPQPQRAPSPSSKKPSMDRPPVSSAAEENGPPSASKPSSAPALGTPAAPAGSAVAAPAASGMQISDLQACPSRPVLQSPFAEGSCKLACSPECHAELQVPLKKPRLVKQQPEQQQQEQQQEEQQQQQQQQPEQQQEEQQQQQQQQPEQQQEEQQQEQHQQQQPEQQQEQQQQQQQPPSPTSCPWPVANFLSSHSRPDPQQLLIHSQAPLPGPSRPEAKRPPSPTLTCPAACKLQRMQNGEPLGPCLSDGAPMPSFQKCHLTDMPPHSTDSEHTTHSLAPEMDISRADKLVGCDEAIFF